MLPLGILLLLAAAQASAAGSETPADQTPTLLNRLLIAGCIAGLAVVLILVLIQMRSTQGKAEPKARPARRKATPEKTIAFRCRRCGRVFKEELTKECTIKCPLCDHVWTWPPPIELKLLEDRMIAFASDPDNPRGNLTFATKAISRLSKDFAQRMLIAGKYLEPGEMLCICEKCREIHITEKKNRGLWGVCVGCNAALLIW